MVRSSQITPTPEPTEHCAPVTLAGNSTETSTARMWLFHDGAMTFQKNTVGAAVGSPVVAANCFPAPVVPGSSTPGMV